LTYFRTQYVETCLCILPSVGMAYLLWVAGLNGILILSNSLQLNYVSSITIIRIYNSLIIVQTRHNTNNLQEKQCVP